MSVRIDPGGNGTYASADGVVGALGGDADDLDVFPRWALSTANLALSAGSVALTFFTPPHDRTIDTISFLTSTTAGVDVTVAKFGLYEVDAEGDLTLVARTDPDATMLGATHTLYSKAFSTTGDYPATFDIVAGHRYAVAVYAEATTYPSLAAVAHPPAVPVMPPRLCSLRTGQSDLPTTIADAGLSSPGGRTVWARVSGA